MKSQIELILEQQKPQDGFLKDLLANIGVHIEGTLTWGAGITAFYGPVKDLLLNQDPKFSEVEIAMVFIAAIALVIKDNSPEIKKLLGLKQVYNYYGMIEQTGSVFLECEKGYFHCSIFSDIFIRNSKLRSSKIKEAGLIQVLSLLPTSYPGHNILTEDLGIIHGIDDCKCGKKGKYFTVLGRIANAELRGCSDVT